MYRFWANNHRLPIVTGQYSKLPRMECLCELCNLANQENEYHYLMKCSHFKLQCEELIDPYCTTPPNTWKMKQLSTNHSNLINLAQFIIILKEFSHTSNANSQISQVQRTFKICNNEKANGQLHENKIICICIDCSIHKLWY